MPHLVKPATSEIVAKLWNLCNVLRDDGVTYHQYVNELTYLLFLKMMQETKEEACFVVSRLAKKKGGAVVDEQGWLWADLVGAAPADRLSRYQDLLHDYSHHGKGIIRQVYAGASTIITKPLTLSTLVTEIDKINWYNVDRDDLGDLYEGLLERNASEKKSGAGQYFTPRDLTDSIVAVMRPTLNDVIQDPTAGTAGFLIAANNYLRDHYPTAKRSKAQKEKHRSSTFYGIELVQDTHRLALMNMLLHGIEGGIQFGDTLGEEGTHLPQATLILSNPPFGSKKGGGLPTRTDLPYPTTNKQLCFLQHIYRNLAPGGRAAVVLPDNVLSGSNVGVDIRRDLMDKCNLHTISRLPTGIFYAQGVKANVVFFDAKPKDGQIHTKGIWFYDLRTNKHFTLKTRTLKLDDLQDFITCYNPENRHERVATERFKFFSYEELMARDKASLDIFWLKDDSLDNLDDLPPPDVLQQEIIEHLEAALASFRDVAVGLRSS